MGNNDKQFPIMNGKCPKIHETIPWSAIEGFEYRAKRNHGQTLEELARRGGLDWFEVYCIIYDKNLFKEYDPNKDWREYRKLVMDWIERDVFIVPVEWVVTGFVSVRASNAQEACAKIEQDNDDIAVPSSPYMEYLDGSFHVSGYPDESAVETCQAYTDDYRRNPHQFNLLNEL